MIFNIDDYPYPGPSGMGVTFNWVTWQFLRLRKHYCQVDIKKPQCPYREASRGSNVWTYYFQQAPLLEPAFPAPLEDPLELPLSGHMAWDIQHQRAIQPFAAEHIRLRADIQAEVDAFRARHFRGRVLAAAIRGTDKVNEYPRMPSSDIIRELKEHRDRLGCETIFLMTDDIRYHQRITGDLGAVSIDIPRSKQSLHHHPPDGPYESGKSVVIDSWLAAGANAFVYTPSNTATIPLIMGRHEEIARLTTECVIYPFSPRVDAALGLRPP